jgi:hypothetical protein
VGAFLAGRADAPADLGAEHVAWEVDGAEEGDVLGGLGSSLVELRSAGLYGNSVGELGAVQVLQGAAAVGRGG